MLQAGTASKRIRAEWAARQPVTNLIVFVNKRQSEEANPSENDQGHHIEP